MPLPTILFGIVLSTLYGSGFHFLRGGSARKLIANLLLGWIGFWGGALAGAYFGWTFWPVGVLNAGMGTVASIALLLLGDLSGRIPWPQAGQEGN